MCSSIISSSFTFPLLPVAVKVNIYSYLSDSNIVSTISLISRSLAKVDNEEILWQQRAIYQLGTAKANECFQEHHTWKKVCRTLSINGIVYFNTISRETETIHQEWKREKGHFKNGVLHGPGERIIYREETTVGNFHEGVLHGQGKITYPHGGLIEGNFENGDLHGKGKIIFNDGTIHEGNFKEGQLDGQGKVTKPDGNVHEGIFLEGLRLVRSGNRILKLVC